MTDKSLKYLEWLDMEIERTNNELQGYYKSIKLSVEESVCNGNLVELIRVAQVKLKTLEIAKQIYQVYHKLI